jgi:hypothetical protein
MICRMLAVSIASGLLLVSDILPVGAQVVGDSDVVITYERFNKTTVEANGVAPLTRMDGVDASQRVAGSERSQCSPSEYGRRSGASTISASDISLSESQHLTAVLKASALANGGHFRTCVGCDPIGNNCVGITGHDTRANAFASSVIQAKLTFSNKITQDFYDLRIATSLPNDMKVKITAPDGSTTTPAAGTARISVKPNDVFYVEARMEIAASNEGGCCNDNKSLTGQFDLRVEKPAILASHKGLQPYIVGGRQTPEGSYPYVVAILIGHDLHCTGTVVGQHTILTAAHCINGYEDRISRGEMSYLIGTVITNPQKGPFPIREGVYPRGADPIQYSPGDHQHDIGLLYTVDNIPTTFAAIQHTSSPPQWSDIVNKQALVFVGFGYNKSDVGDLTGLGIKREAPWQASSADDWRFYFHAANNNTCSGDSGGPAFFQNEQTRELVLVGITSVGDAACTYGADTRMDTHYSWASSKLQ